MVIDSDKMILDINAIHTLLTEGEVQVTFTKKDGTQRIMRCTRNMTLIPTEYHPKPKDPLEETAGRARDPQLLVAFDLDNQGWRSFWYNSIIAVNYTKTP